MTTPHPTPRRQMLLGAQLWSYGSAPGAWRWPAADARAFLGLEAMTEAAQWAERGKMQLLFLADHPAVREDLTVSPPSASIDPIVVTTHVAMSTSRIGIALTQSTTFNFPYTVARQLKALDVISGGRIGWNAITTSEAAIAANYGSSIADRETRYARAHEFVQLVQALWGSFGEDALKLDVDAGVFVDADDVRPINLGGRYVASRGPLPIPPSPQGQPILFQAGGGSEALTLAGEYASGIYSAAVDGPTGRHHRAAIDAAARAAGRDPSEISIFMGVFTTVAETEEAAMQRRRELMDLAPVPLDAQLAHLSALVGIQLSPASAHEPLSVIDRAALAPSPHALHSVRAVRLLQEGKTPYEVLLHGVLEFHTTVIGSPEQVADQLEQLFHDGAADGFFIIPDVVADGMPAFVEGVIPILQERGLFHEDYEGTTLREHLGVPHQYGRRSTAS